MYRKGNFEFSGGRLALAFTKRRDILFLPNNAGVDALSIERSYEGGWMIFFRFGNVIVSVGAGSAKLKYRCKQLSLVHTEGSWIILFWKLGNTLENFNDLNDWITTLDPRYHTSTILVHTEGSWIILFWKLGNTLENFNDLNYWITTLDPRYHTSTIFHSSPKCTCRDIRNCRIWWLHIDSKLWPGILCLTLAKN